eukprot:SAG22_NODE_13392_length_408_cov_1.000000_1_plen_70_part_01
MADAAKVAAEMAAEAAKYGAGEVPADANHFSLRVGKPPLDIMMFREEKGGNPELVRESQRRRFPVDPIDE